MTIKAIKEQYKRYRCDSADEHNSFVVYDYNDGNGKMVVIVTHSILGKDVTGVIRVSDGYNMIGEDRCRPCDNLDDAIDVAGEMMEN